MDSKAQLTVFAADIGSVEKGRFGWASQSASGSEQGPDPAQMVSSIAQALGQGLRVALGFECPLWVDLPKAAAELTRARKGEGNRSWSAGAGAGALATGLVEVAWILRELRNLAPTRRAFLRWSDFEQAGSGLFLWEAFVTGDAKADTHAGDAALAVKAFHCSLPNPELHAAVTPKSTEVFSLVGAAMLRSGWSDDPAVLSRPCVVIRATSLD